MPSAVQRLQHFLIDAIVLQRDRHPILFIYTYFCSVVATCLQPAHLLGGRNKDSYHESRQLWSPGSEPLPDARTGASRSQKAARARCSRMPSLHVSLCRGGTRQLRQVVSYSSAGVVQLFPPIILHGI
eukprot:762689-Hanusia_phi.AAC.3